MAKEKEKVVTKAKSKKKPRMPKAVVGKEDDVSSRVAGAITEFIAKVPKTVVRHRANPEAQADTLITSAAKKAALVAGGLALPPGPIGWLTILPEMVTVWKIQAQLVADVAALYGKKSLLTKNTMMYCLFRHTAAQAMRDVAVRVGERMLVKRASLRVMQSVAKRVGVKVTQRAIGKGISRFIPFIGAGVVAGYAYYDTSEVGKTTAKLFSMPIEVQ